MTQVRASEHVGVQPDGRTIRITLRRAAKKNAITLAMYSVLADAFRAAEDDPGCSAVVLTGEGDSFCAGNDIGDFVAASDDGLASEAVRFLETLNSLTVPVVAAVRGVAIGIGTTMLLHCDVVYAAPDARFRLPFVDLALVPEAGSSYLLPQVAGHRRAAGYMLLGTEFGAEEAQAAGIVTEVVAADGLAAAVDGTVEALAAKPPAALRATKALLRAPDREPVGAAMQREFIAFRERLTSAEAQQLFQGFLSRR